MSVCILCREDGARLSGSVFLDCHCQENRFHSICWLNYCINMWSETNDGVVKCPICRAPLRHYFGYAITYSNIMRFTVFLKDKTIQSNLILGFLTIFLSICMPLGNNNVFLAMALLSLWTLVIQTQVTRVVDSTTILGFSLVTHLVTLLAGWICLLWNIYLRTHAIIRWTTLLAGSTYVLLKYFIRLF